MKKAFPGEPVYRGYTPTGFQRPSTLLEIAGGKFYPNAACGSVELRPRVQLTIFVETDSYHQPKEDQELTRRQMTLLGLFLPGYIRVKDRAPKVQSMEADTSFFDCAVVTLTLALTLDRADFVGPELYELMQNLELQVRVKKENDT